MGFILEFETLTKAKPTILRCQHGSFECGLLGCPNWAINGEFDYLSLTVDAITGRVLAYNGSVSFRPIQHLSFALGYTGLNFSVNAIRNKFDGYLKWGYNGPTLTATFSFGRKSWK